MKESNEYVSYTTGNGIEVYIPKEFTNQEQRSDYHNFIVVLADALVKYAAKTAVSKAEPTN